jgi:hypothetical protein
MCLKCSHSSIVYRRERALHHPSLHRQNCLRYTCAFNAQEPGRRTGLLHKGEVGNITCLVSDSLLHFPAGTGKVVVAVVYLQ